MKPEEDLAAARKAIASADAFLIAAGAGMGVDSGLPDFRGPEGFWRAYPAAKALGLRFEQLANPQWFARDPHLAWGFYGHRLNLYRATPPHEGYSILLKWAKHKGDYFVFTSNVDGHFQRAGFQEERIVECHGSIHHLQCSRPCDNSVWPSDLTLAVDESTLRCDEPLPKCPRCGSIARPNVLMFNDPYWVSDRSDSRNDRFVHWLRRISAKQLVIIECGAGLAVPTVRSTCDDVAAAYQRATLIRINLREPHGPNGCISLPVAALEALRRLNQR